MEDSQWRAHRYATIAAMRPNDYKECVKSTGLGITEKEALSPTAWAEEYLLMGLRIKEGISLSRFEEISGEGLPNGIIQELFQNNLLIQHGDKIKATSEGRILLNSVTAKLLGA